MADCDVRPPLSEREAIDMIKRYLPLEWSNLTDDQVTIEKLTGGYINTVNVVTRSTESVLEPKQVVVHRANGGYHRERGDDTPFATRIEELLVFYESSKMGTAPKLYGMCEELTVQEYFEGHTLTPDDCLDLKMLTKVAQTYAKFHSMNLPMGRVGFDQSISGFKRGYNEFGSCKERIESLLKKTYPDLQWHDLFQVDYSLECEKVFELMNQIGYRKVIITGDQNYLNVLVSEDGNRVALIDYEMAKFSPRSLDLGGHLLN